MTDAPEHNIEKMEKHIFNRELAEVFLILGYLSGRSDKGLAAAFGDKCEQSSKTWIEEVCDIPWSERDPKDRSKRAEILSYRQPSTTTATQRGYTPTKMKTRG